MILGIIIGVEIPVLTRIMRQHENLREAISDVLSFDYLGALIASFLFPLVLLPWLGTMRTAFIIGLLNLCIAVLNIFYFKKYLKQFTASLIVSGIVFVFLLGGFLYSFKINSFFEQFLYRDEVMYSKQTNYQKVVITRWNQDTRMYINGNLQFSTRDEYRYHEAITHIPAALTMNLENVLVLGGGDGLVARELLYYPIKKIEVVDLDPDITILAKTHPVFKNINKEAFLNSKVKIYNQDAYKFIENASDLYDLIIIDLPDPNDTALGKLYTKEFYGMLKKRMSVGGILVTQSASPYFAPEVFWCIHHTLEEPFDAVVPYSVYMPTFGQWGFNMAFQTPLKTENEAAFQQEILKQLDSKLFNNKISYRYLNREMLPGIFKFDQDMKERSTQINQLTNQVIIDYYSKGWDNWR